VKVWRIVAAVGSARFDLVIADEAMSRRINVTAFTHLRGSTATSFSCARSPRIQLVGSFPGNLTIMPMLIQGACAAVRQQLEGGCRATRFTRAVSASRASMA